VVRLFVDAAGWLASSSTCLGSRPSGQAAGGLHVGIEDSHASHGRRSRFVKQTGALVQANAAFLNDALRAFGDQPYNAGAGPRIAGGVGAADQRAQARQHPAPADVEKVRCGARQARPARRLCFAGATGCRPCALRRLSEPSGMAT